MRGHFYILVSDAVKFREEEGNDRGVLFVLAETDEIVVETKHYYFTCVVNGNNASAHVVESYLSDFAGVVAAFFYLVVALVDPNAYGAFLYFHRSRDRKRGPCRSGASRWLSRGRFFSNRAQLN